MELIEELQYSLWPFGPWRCAARMVRGDSMDRWGRCELKPHSSEIDHALEAGMYVVRWKCETRISN